MIGLVAAVMIAAAPLQAKVVPVAQARTPIEVALKDGKVAGPRTYRVHQGDAVSLRVASDRAIALHLHGYDIERTAEPGSPALFEFTARATGRFSIEEHLAASAAPRPHAPAVLYLEVLPN